MRVRIDPKRIVLTLTYDADEVTDEEAVLAFAKFTEPLLARFEERWPAAAASVDVEVHGGSTTDTRRRRMASS